MISVYKPGQYAAAAQWARYGISGMSFSDVWLLSQPGPLCEPLGVGPVCSVDKSCWISEIPKKGFHIWESKDNKPMKTINQSPNPEPNKHIDNNVGMRVQSMMMLSRLQRFSYSHFISATESEKRHPAPYTINIKCSFKYWNTVSQYRCALHRCGFRCSVFIYSTLHSVMRMLIPQTLPSPTDSVV